MYLLSMILQNSILFVLKQKNTKKIFIFLHSKDFWIPKIPWQHVQIVTLEKNLSQW